MYARPPRRARRRNIGNRTTSVWHNACQLSTGPPTYGRRDAHKSGRRLRMTRWVVRLVPLTVLLATTAVAAPIWVRNGNETEVRGRVTDVDSTGTQVVIE